MDDAGWLDQYREVPPLFEKPLTSWIRSLPVVSEGDPPVWLELSSVTPQGKTVKRKLIGHGLTNIIGHGSRVEEPLFHLEIRDESSSQVPSPLAKSYETLHFYINVASFERGDPPEKFVVWSEGFEEIAYLRGLPRPRAYRPGVIRYLKLPPPIDGVRTQRAAAQVDFRHRDRGVTWRYRCDLWLADEIPFGIAQIETTVSDPRRGDILLKERWTVTATSLKSPEKNP